MITMQEVLEFIWVKFIKKNFEKKYDWREDYEDIRLWLKLFWNVDWAMVIQLNGLNGIGIAYSRKDYDTYRESIMTMLLCIKNELLRSGKIK